MIDKKESRLRRARATRARIALQKVNRLTVFRTNLHIYANVISSDGARVLAHPPAVPRERDDGHEEDRDADDVGSEIEEGPRQHAHRDAGEHAGEGAEDAAEGDVAVVVARRDLVEVGADDAEKQRRLEGLAERDDEGGAHRSYSATIRPFAVVS